MFVQAVLTWFDICMALYYSSIGLVGTFSYVSMELQINNMKAETKLIKKFSDYKQQKKAQMIIDGKEL